MKIEYDGKKLSVQKVKIGDRIRASDIWDHSNEYGAAYVRADSCVGVGQNYKGIMRLYRIKESKDMHLAAIRAVAEALEPK